MPEIRPCVTKSLDTVPHAVARNGWWLDAEASRCWTGSREPAHMVTAEFQFTSDHFVVSLERYRQQHRGRLVGLLVKGLVIAVLAPIVLWMFWRGHLAIGLFLAAFGGFMFVAHHVDFWIARRSLRKSPYCDEVITVEMTEADMHSRSARHEARLQWSAFTKAVHFRDGFLLFQGPKAFNWIPLSALADPSQAVELEALLRSRIAGYRDFGRRGA